MRGHIDDVHKPPACGRWPASGPQTLLQKCRDARWLTVGPAQHTWMRLLVSQAWRAGSRHEHLPCIAGVLGPAWPTWAALGTRRRRHQTRQCIPPAASPCAVGPAPASGISPFWCAAETAHSWQSMKELYRTSDVRVTHILPQCLPHEVELEVNLRPFRPAAGSGCLQNTEAPREQVSADASPHWPQPAAVICDSAAPSTCTWRRAS